MGGLLNEPPFVKADGTKGVLPCVWFLFLVLVGDELDNVKCLVEPFKRGGAA